MPTVTMTMHGGDEVFSVVSTEPVIKNWPHAPSSRERLEAAVRSISGACAECVGRERVPHPSGVDEERLTFVLAVSAANVHALLAAECLWDETASQRAVRFDISIESVSAAQRRLNKTLRHLAVPRLPVPDVQGRSLPDSEPPQPLPSPTPQGRRTVGARVLDALFGAAEFGLECLLGALAGALTLAMMFLPFGFLGLILSGDWHDWQSLLMFPLLGAILGAVIGVGYVFVARFSDPEFVPQSSAESLMDVVEEAYCEFSKPRAVRLIEFLHGLWTKDYSRARPGRWKRALIGALAAGIPAGIFVWSAAPYFARVQTPVGIQVGFFLVPTVLAAIAGGLTDSI